MQALCLSFFGAALFQTVAAQSSVSLAITSQPTQGASGIISPSFAGFGIEPSNLYSFTGGSSNNDLTTNLLSNLANYTGTPPHLRIGGNTQDYMIFESSMNDYVVKPNPNPVGQGAFASDLYIIGPRFFEVIDRFPSNTPITFGLNLAYEESDYIDRITDMATQALARLDHVNVVGFEIGNEPDLYLQNGFRTGSWSGQAYTQQWLDRASAIWSQVLHPNGMQSNFFEPGATASTIGTSFQIELLDQDGITILANGSSHSYVSSWNQHDYYYYIGVSTYPLTQYEFMTLSTTNNQFASWTEQIKQGLDTGLPYALREMGVVGPIGMDEITNVFGASLWTLNFLFYAATLNISSVQMHMTDNSNASAWQPIEYYGNQPYVRPNYYAFAAFDQAIGPTCEAQVGGFILQDAPDEYNGRSAAYSVYQGGLLSSIVLINSNPSNVSESNKGSLTFDLSLPTQFAGQDVYLSYLTNDGADAKHGTTWNGISYEQNGDGTPTRVDDTVETVTIGDDGSVSITVRDTQAVIANIGSPIGEKGPNQSACAALAASTPDAKPVATPVGTNSVNAAAKTIAASSSRTGSSAGATKTNGIARVSVMLFTTLISACLSGFILIFV